MSIIDVDPVEDFLAHHGVKGQKWGFRNALRKAPHGDFHRRSGAQKAGLISGAFVGYAAAGALLKRVLIQNPKYLTLLSTHPGRASAISVGALGVSAAATIAGARLTRNLLQKHGKTPVSKLPKKL